MTPRDWNEIKKLLADVAKGNDVQEVLKKVELKKWCGEFETVEASATTSTVTLLDVTGKGRLYGLMCYCGYNNGTSTTVLTIDGVSYTIKVKGTNSTNNRNGFVLCSPDALTGDTPSVPLLHGNSLNGIFTKIAKLETATHSDGCPRVWIPIDGFLEFENALKITINGFGDNSTSTLRGCATYMLSE